jgi:hypothetical protein
MKRLAIQSQLLTAGVLAVFCLVLLRPAAQAQEQITVTGKLSRVMAIGGESTGWSIHLDHPKTIEGKEMDSLEIDYPKTTKLEKLENNEVKASGKLTHRHGVETGERLVFEVGSMHEVKQN